MKINHWPDAKRVEHGDFSLDLSQGAVRNIRYKNSLIIDQLYALIRPLDWSTLKSDQHIDQIEIIDGICNIKITDSYFNTLISHTLITLGLENTFTVDHELEAKAEYSVNRWGVCFCLNTHDWMGAKVVSSAGEFQLPVDIAPQRVVDGVTLGIFPAANEMELQAADGRTLLARSTGKILEAEDQRNWTDNTYKIYSGSLAEPLPFITSEGSSWSQSISFEVGPSNRQSDNDSKISVTEIKSLPSIGLQFNESSLLAVDDLDKAFILLDIDHVRINEESLDAQKISAATKNGLVVEAALFSENGLPEIHQDISELNSLIPAGSRILVHRQGRAIVDSTALPKNNSLSVFIPGTDAYLVDLHRNNYAFDESVSYSMVPTVNTSDLESIFKSLQTQSESVRFAKEKLAPQVFISPITFSTRGNPETGHAKALRSECSDPEIALRIRTIEGAAWTLGSIFALAESGANSGTWHELFGHFGIIYQQDGAVKFSPVFHALAALTAHHAHELTIARAADNSWVAFENRESGRMLVASLRPWAQELSPRVLFGYQFIQSLRVEDGERASQIMDWWSYIEKYPIIQDIPLTLSPFEVALIKG